MHTHMHRPLTVTFLLRIAVVASATFGFGQFAPSSNPPCAILAFGFLQGGKLCGPSAANLITIQISPGSQSTTVGTNAAYTATGGYDDGSFVDVTATSTWGSSDISIASPIAPNPGSNPILYSCNNAGSVNITASLSGIVGAASLTCVAIPPCTITSTSLPGGTVGSPYSTAIQDVDCVPPNVWSLSSGSLPSGLALNSSTGVISGTPVGPAGTANFVVRVQDFNSSISTQSLSITISAAQVNAGDPAPPQVFVDPDECNTTPTQQLFVDGGVGTGHYPSTIAGWKSAIAQAESDRKNLGVGTFINMRPFWDGAVQTVFRITSASDQVFHTQIAGDTSANCIILRSTTFPTFIPSGPINPYVTGYVSVTRLGGVYTISYLPKLFAITIPASSPGYVQLTHMSNPTFNGTYLIGSYDSGTGVLVTATNTAAGTNANSFGFSKVSKAPTTGGLYDMWRVELAGSVNPPIEFDLAAHHYQFQGLELVSFITTGFSADLIQMGQGQQIDPANNGQHIHITRSYFHGYDKFNSGTGDIETNTSNAMRMNCQYCSITRTKIDQIHKVGSETHSILVKNSAGPVLIWNNDIESASAGIFFGGDPPQLGNGTIIISDAEVSGNQVGRDFDWYMVSNSNFTGNKWGIKNLIEMKFCVRCVVWGNRFHINWADGQSGFWNLQTPRACAGVCSGGSFNLLSDILFANNVISDSDQGVQQTGRSGPAQGNGGGVTPAARREKYRNNLVWGMGIHQVSGSSLMQMGTNGEDYPATASRDTCPGGACITTYALTAALNSPHHGMVAPDFVRITGCIDTTFNADKWPTIAPTDYAIQPLTVYIQQIGAAPSASTTGCSVNNGEGLVEAWKWEHNTVISDSVSKFMSDAHAKTFMKGNVFRNNLWASVFPTIGMFCTGSVEGWTGPTTGSETCFDTDTLIWHHQVMAGIDVTKYAEFPGAVKPPITLWNPQLPCAGVPNAGCIGFAGNYDFSNPELSGLISQWKSSSSGIVNIQYIGNFLYSDSKVIETYDPGVSGPIGGTYTVHQGINITNYARTAGVATLTLMYPAVLLGSVGGQLFSVVPANSSFNTCTGGPCIIFAIGSNTVSYLNAGPDVADTPIVNSAAIVFTGFVANFYARDRNTGAGEGIGAVVGDNLRLGTISSSFGFRDWRLCTGVGLPDSRCLGPSYYSAGQPGAADDGKDEGVDFTELLGAIDQGRYGQRFPH